MEGSVYFVPPEFYGVGALGQNLGLAVDRFKDIKQKQKEEARLEEDRKIASEERARNRYLQNIELMKAIGVAEPDISEYAQKTKVYELPTGTKVTESIDTLKKRMIAAQPEEQQRLSLGIAGPEDVEQKVAGLHENVLRLNEYAIQRFGPEGAKSYMQKYYPKLGAEFGKYGIKLTPDELEADRIRALKPGTTDYNIHYYKHPLGARGIEIESKLGRQLTQADISLKQAQATRLRTEAAGGGSPALEKVQEEYIASWVRGGVPYFTAAKTILSPEKLSPEEHKLLADATIAEINRARKDQNPAQMINALAAAQKAGIEFGDAVQAAATAEAINQLFNGRKVATVERTTGFFGGEKWKLQVSRQELQGAVGAPPDAMMELDRRIKAAKPEQLDAMLQEVMALDDNNQLKPIARMKLEEEIAARGGTAPTPAVQAPQKAVEPPTAGERPPAAPKPAPVPQGALPTGERPPAVGIGPKGNAGQMRKIRQLEGRLAYYKQQAGMPFRSEEQIKRLNEEAAKVEAELKKLKETK